MIFMRSCIRRGFFVIDANMIHTNEDVFYNNARIIYPFEIIGYV